MVVCMFSDRATFRSCEFGTDSVTPPGLTDAVALPPGLQPPLFVLHIATPVNPTSGTLKPNDFCPTQKPFPICWFSMAGSSCECGLKGCGVTRSCAAPSHVWVL